MCNVFKPERCHHCSTCNRCVLNMDHHCPWVNNCIGFSNRKCFLLLLVYVLLSAYYCAITLVYDVYVRIEEQYTNINNGINDKIGFFNMLMVISGFVITFLASFIMTNFFRFHVTLVRENKTTIEFLEKKGDPFAS